MRAFFILKNHLTFKTPETATERKKKSVKSSKEWYLAELFQDR